MGNRKDKAKKEKIANLKPTVFDKLILVHVPKWFEVLGWIALLGVLRYIYEKTGDYWVLSLYIVSYFSVVFYAQAYCYNVIYLKSKNGRKIWALLIAIIIGLSIGFFLETIVSKLAPHN